VTTPARSDLGCESRKLRGKSRPEVTKRTGETKESRGRVGQWKGLFLAECVSHTRTARVHTPRDGTPSTAKHGRATLLYFDHSLADFRPGLSQKFPFSFQALVALDVLRDSFYLI